MSDDWSESLRRPQPAHILNESTANSRSATAQMATSADSSHVVGSSVPVKAVSIPSHTTLSNHSIPGSLNFVKPHAGKPLEIVLDDEDDEASDFVAKRPRLVGTTTTTPLRPAELALSSTHTPTRTSSLVTAQASTPSAKLKQYHYQPSTPAVSPLSGPNTTPSQNKADDKSSIEPLTTDLLLDDWPLDDEKDW
jgi:hypothetical protein